MTNTAILFPVFVQVGLTFFLMFMMGKERFAAYRSKSLEMGPDGTHPIWKGRAAIASNAFHNQFEMPTLFYAVVAFAMLANGVDDFMLVLAWAYAILRLVHAFIHTTYNHVPHRFFAYLASNAVLLLMWVKLALHVV